MKKEFAAFYRPTDEEFRRLWSEGWFVLDANVLLNLYRYQEEARGDFLKVLQNLAPRIWVPHQAVLEYQRNRVKTIREQLKKFRDVRKLINFQALDDDLGRYNERMRSLIDPAAFLASVKPHYEAFERQIAEVEAKQITVESDATLDPVRTVLDALLDGKVGPGFTQTELDALHVEGEQRYKLETPPGYVDPQKKGVYEYQWSGRTYKRQFGDWILWKQVLDWARENKIKDVVFVTDDRTEDWWNVVAEPGEAKRTIGPRPELAAEIKEEAGVQLFYMYQPDRFLDRATTALNLSVASSSIQEVREVNERESRRDASITFDDFAGIDFDKHAIQFWARVNGQEKLCMVAQETLSDYFGVHGQGEQMLGVFNLNRRTMEDVAREVIRSGRYDSHGRVRITLEDITSMKKNYWIVDQLRKSSRILTSQARELAVKLGQPAGDVGESAAADDIDSVIDEVSDAYELLASIRSGIPGTVDQVAWERTRVADGRDGEEIFDRLAIVMHDLIQERRKRD